MILELSQSMLQLPTFVRDPRYEGTLKQAHMQELWSEAPDLASQLVEAQGRVFSGDDTVAPFLEAATENTTVYLNDVVKDLNDKVTKSNEVVSQPFAVGDASFFVDTKKGTQRQPLDLTVLGLPEFKQRRKDDDFRPLAVVVHSAQKTGDVGAVQLIVTNGTKLESRYLENITAIQDFQTPTQPRWVEAGDTLTSRSTIEPAVEKTVGKRGDVMLKVTSNDAFYGKVEGGTAHIIRQTPTRTEKTVSSSNHLKKPGKTLTRLGVAATGLALAATVSSLFSSDPGKNREITTAHELVLPAGTATHNGVKQAENFFDEDELSRSRKAFEAYFAGDTNALRNQAKALGYESNWITPEAVTSLQEAKTYEELVQAFDKALEGLPVKLKIYSDASQAEGLASSTRYEHQLASNFSRARELALSVVRVFNTMDKEYLIEKKMEALNYIITGKITNKQPNRADPAGYFNDNGKQSNIILSDADDFFIDAQDLVGHETAHYTDLSKNEHGDLSGNTYNLHPGQYVGLNPDDYLGTSTEHEEWHAVADVYGNANAKEDTATAQEEINRPNPYMRWENSPLTEKQTAIIFEMEKKYPGFTASLLQRTTTDHRWETTSLFETVTYETKDYVAHTWVAFGLSMLALMGRAGRRKLSEMTTRNFGV